MAKGYLLSEDDIGIIQDIVNKHRRRLGNNPGRYGPNEIDPDPSDIFIARTPESGIPAMTFDPTNLGRDRPGEARCFIFRIAIAFDGLTSTSTTSTTTTTSSTTTTTTTPDPSTTTTTSTTTTSNPNPYAELLELEYVDEVVYNLTSAGIPGNCWIIVVRDRSGYWLFSMLGACDTPEVIGGTTSTTSTTTTTSTTPEPCPGHCLWEWYESVDGCFWILDSSTCDEECNCLYPTICGNAFQCTTTRTSCSTGNNNPPGCDCILSTTTTEDPLFTTTTTTTLSPECADGCYWKWRYDRWWLEENNCDSSCPCSHPGPSPGDECIDAFTPCIPPPPPVPPTRCVGHCVWSYNADILDWILVDNECNAGSDGLLCWCDPPFYVGNDCGLGFTPCHSPTTTTPEPGTDPETVTTTTPSPGDCVGSCYWRWSNDLMQWVNYDTNCIGCYCDIPPGYDGIDDCEIAETPCRTGTTTTSTTTTTTTIDPCSGECKWYWDSVNSIWILERFCPLSTPEDGCGCPQPSIVGSTHGQVEFTNCGTATTTTTAEPTTTTTPEPECYTEPCWWLWNGSAWDLQPGVNCVVPTYADCMCQQPIGPGSFVNDLRPTSCEGGGFTTSTTTTFTTAEPSCTNYNCVYYWDGSNWRIYGCSSPSELGCQCTGTTSDPAPSQPAYFVFPCAVTTTTTTTPNPMCPGWTEPGWYCADQGGIGFGCHNLISCEEVSQNAWTIHSGPYPNSSCGGNC